MMVAIESKRKKCEKILIIYWYQIITDIDNQSFCVSARNARQNGPYRSAIWPVLMCDSVRFATRCVSVCCGYV